MSKESIKADFIQSAGFIRNHSGEVGALAVSILASIYKPDPPLFWFASLIINSALTIDLARRHRNELPSLRQKTQRHL